MANTQKPCIGFVGLGAMGFGMALNLVKQGYPVKGFDVFPPTVQRFKDAGGLASSSLADAAEPYCICMVATPAQVQSALFDGEGSLSECIKKALPKGATLLLCSTTPSTYVRSVQEKLKLEGRDDISLVDCPVSGGAIRAAEGTLSIMAGGSDRAIEAARFLLEEMSDMGKLAIVQGGIGAGSDMKMAHQVLAAIHILAANEAMGLASRLGLDLSQVRESIVKSEAWSFMHENRSPRMLEEKFTPPASALTIILKDVGIVTSMARLQSFPTPLTSIAEQVYLSGLSHGMGAEDDAGLIRLYLSKLGSQPVPKPNGTSEVSASNMNLVITLLKGIHLCAAAEAIAFADHLGLDTSQFSGVVNSAAGGSWMFRDRGPRMIAKFGKYAEIEWTAKDKQNTIESSVDSMVTVIQAARDADCPLYLGNVAYNILLAMKRRGWDKCADASVVNFWGKQV
ncbi:hypothetical protein MMC11_002477 [Xylographa trunciseda]|nr:hypothetical protein [Xylographa trunciseda]